VTLPYWDPKSRAYGVARAALGVVKVTGTAKPAVIDRPGAVQGPRLKGLVTPPPKLGASGAAPASYWPSRPGYWLLLFGAPLSALLAFALADAKKALQQRLAEKRGSLGTAQERALSELQTAARKGDAAACASAAERALVIAIERATKIKARGVLKKDLPPKLGEAGVAPDVAEHAATLLARCDELRFAGEAPDLGTLAGEVRDVCGKLSKLQPRAGGGDKA
jgi:hypothetical protein